MKRRTSQMPTHGNFSFGSAIRRISRSRAGAGSRGLGAHYGAGRPRVHRRRHRSRVTTGYRHMVFVLKLPDQLDVSPAGRRLRLAPCREVAAAGPVSSVVTRALACAYLARGRELAGSA
jgi:hypothetical protein